METLKRLLFLQMGYCMLEGVWMWFSTDYRELKSQLLISTVWKNLVTIVFFENLVSDNLIFVYLKRDTSKCLISTTYFTCDKQFG